MCHVLISILYSNSQIVSFFKFRGFSPLYTWVLSSGIRRCGNGQFDPTFRGEVLFSNSTDYFSEEHGRSGRINLRESKDIKLPRNVSIRSTISSGLLFWTVEVIKTIFKSQTPTSQIIHCVFKEKMVGYYVSKIMNLLWQSCKTYNIWAKSKVKSI
jgi:hypothetical protein